MCVCVCVCVCVSARALCVYNLIACSSKNLCGIAQLDVGYVTVCSTKREHKEFLGVALSGMDGQGCYKTYKKH
jgi:hypothetical protein